ncbi:TPA: hypothetical protein ACIUA0_001079, partial [Salmonella enterica subsp. enterica serovar Virchow]
KSADSINSQIVLFLFSRNFQKMSISLRRSLAVLALKWSVSSLSSGHAPGWQRQGSRGELVTDDRN